ncbi:Aste57867_19904 [Aphanomyces stellatus]|uniref:Aste57867_19904 protein n=1 Tax=Aphanomyces stellatus TaxID=120398 RepID=A0A485LDQ6_9STRA|nr:hypothetical protein As57867_019838 [Aphanomyces stellatus]VFT96602.1 Aste57867_19904 [Aphanomyces stellatus]
MAAIAIVVAIATWLASTVVNATAASNNTLLSKCPPQATISGTPLVCVSMNGNISFISMAQAMLSLAARNLTAVECLPKEPHVIDLSCNAIASIPKYETPSSVLILTNLSHNALTRASPLKIPSNVNILDLSYNRINYWAFNFSKLTKLTELYVRGNGLTRVVLNKTMPLSLTDLTDNPLTSVTVDRTFYGQVNDPDFRLLYTVNDTVRPLQCAETGDIVCVLGGEAALDCSDGSLVTTKAVVTWLGVAVVGGIFGRALFLYCRRRRQRQTLLADRERRVTICSSACAVYDDATMQFRRSVTAIPRQQS